MRRLDPRIGNIHLDANAFDHYDDGTDVARLLELKASGEIKLIVPMGVRLEGLNPKTPPDVSQNIAAQIFSIDVQRTSDERRTIGQIRTILQGNGKAGQHDADADHLFEASKYGGRYFITHDRRLNKTKRAELEALLHGFSIVTLAEFLAIYDDYAREDS